MKTTVWLMFMLELCQGKYYLIQGAGRGEKSQNETAVDGVDDVNGDNGAGAVDSVDPDVEAGSEYYDDDYGDYKGTLLTKWLECTKVELGEVQKLDDLHY